MRPELELISEWIRPNARVLDLGCGDGALLAYLQRTSPGQRLWSGDRYRQPASCIQAGVNVIHADLEAGLADFGDSSFDYVIMTQTLQAVKHTEALLDEMLRVGRQGIVTFPNFGFWRCRIQIALQGLMPVVKTLPYQWYDTPNVHLFTIRDFETLCRRKRIDILQRTVLDHAHRPRPGPQLWPNLLGEIALYRLGRA
jgi:methionine biosynthesis protein MetW